MQRLVDLSTGETLIRDISDRATFDEVLYAQDSDYDIEADMVLIDNDPRYVDDLYLIDDKCTYYRTLPEFVELWWYTLTPRPLILEDIEEYSRDSGVDLATLMAQVGEL